MERLMGKESEGRVQDIFFADKNKWREVEEEREKELGRIIMRAREAVKAEFARLLLPEFVKSAEDSLRKIRSSGKISGIENNVPGADPSDSADLSDDDNAEDYKDTENDKDAEDEVKLSTLYKAYGLDEEEADIFALLTGLREPRENDVLPDEELLNEFKVFRMKKKPADWAVKELARGHMGLIVSIARQYKNKGLSFMELIQEGYKGAHRAAERFDVSRNVRFTTYAAWWIRQGIIAAIEDKSREIRYPRHLSESLNRFRRAKNEARHSGRNDVTKEPKIDLVAKLMQGSRAKVKKLMNLPYADKILDAPVKGFETEASMHEFIADSAAVSPEKAAEDSDRSRLIENLLDALNERERTIIIKRFGLFGAGEPETLEKAGNGDLTRERVRQIESMALRKMARKLNWLMQGCTCEDLV